MKKTTTPRFPKKGYSFHQNLRQTIRRSQRVLIRQPRILRSTPNPTFYYYSNLYQNRRFRVSRNHQKNHALRPLTIFEQNIVWEWMSDNELLLYDIFEDS